MLILYTTEDGKLSREATVKESSVVQMEGNRKVHRPVTLYNLDAIPANADDPHFGLLTWKGAQVRKQALQQKL